MAANLYARSIFGEDALANVSIEKPLHLGPDAPVNGHIRIRAKSQVGPAAPRSLTRSVLTARDAIECVQQNQFDFPIFYWTVLTERDTT